MYDFYFHLVFILTLLYTKSDTATLLRLWPYIEMVQSLLMPTAPPGEMVMMRGNYVRYVFRDEKNNSKLLLLKMVDIPFRWTHIKAEIDSEDEISIDTIDVTDHILKICSPNKCFYGQPITPKILNPDWNKLYFIYRTRKGERMITINRDEIIQSKLK